MDMTLWSFSFFQTIFRISELTSQEMVRWCLRLICVLLNTLDYCLSSSHEQVDQILAQIRSEDLRLQVTLEPVQQKLLVTQTVGMSVLLSKFEADLLPALQFYLENWLGQSYERTRSIAVLYENC